MAGKKVQLLTFNLHGRHYALPLERVERVIRAVEPTPLPRGPENVMGVINLAGRIIPVFDLRRKFQFPERDLTPDDCFVIACTSHQAVALAVDSSDGVVEHNSEEIVPTESIVNRSEQVRGIIRLRDELLLIQDLDQFLTADQQRQLQNALAGEAQHAS